MVDPADNPDPLGLAGQTLAGRYAVLEPIGRGGMCLVYLARHTLIDKTVAIKVLRPELAESVESNSRFHREAMAAASVHHDHIVDVADYGFTDAGQAFLVMEHLQGESLRQLVTRAGALPGQRCVNIARQILGALCAAHARGIIHRDLKSDNVFLAQRDGVDHVKLLDFGISKLLRPVGDEERLASLTATGVVMGTPHYISPEAIHGEDVDQRSDIYSLGVILYEMVTGQLPFEAPSVVALLFKQVNDPPRAPSEVRPDLKIPLALEQVVLRALRKEPDERFASAQEMLDALPLEPERPTTPLPRARRAPWWPWAALALALVGVAVVLLSRDGPRHEARRTKRAVAEKPWRAPPSAADLGRPDARETIQLRVTARPPRATIWIGGERIGVGTAARRVPRSQAPLELSVRAPGFQPRTLTVVPARDVELQLTLVPIARPPKKKRGAVDLYGNPYHKH